MDYAHESSPPIPARIQLQRLTCRWKRRQLKPLIPMTQRQINLLSVTSAAIQAQVLTFWNNTCASTSEKPFKCDHCDYSCALAHHLKVHKRKHTGEKPFRCDQCEYASTQASHLKEHKRKHTGEELYKCKVCKYFSKTVEGMKYHMLSHTGQKPFSCNECDYTCKTSSQLKRHMKRHNQGPNA